MEPVIQFLARGEFDDIVGKVTKEYVVVPYDQFGAWLCQQVGKIDHVPASIFLFAASQRENQGVTYKHPGIEIASASFRMTRLRTEGIEWACQALKDALTKRRAEYVAIRTRPCIINCYLKYPEELSS